jgi:hypothetical protein
VAKLRPIHDGWHWGFPQPASGYAKTPPMKFGSMVSLSLASSTLPAAARPPSTPKPPVK